MKRLLIFVAIGIFISILMGCSPEQITQTKSKLQLNPSSLAFEVSIDSIVNQGIKPVPKKTTKLSNTGNAISNYTIKSKPDWIADISPNTGTIAVGGNQEISVTVSLCKASGAETGTIIFKDADSTAVLNVTRVCKHQPKSRLQLNPTSLTFEVNMDAITSQGIKPVPKKTSKLSNTGNAISNYTIKSKPDWIADISPNAGSLDVGESQEISITTNICTTVGTETGAIVFKDTDSEATLAVTRECSAKAELLIVKTVSKHDIAWKGGAEDKTLPQTGDYSDSSMITEYSITVTNNSSTIFKNLTVTDELPPELGFANVNSIGLFDPGLHQITWDVGDLAPRHHIVVKLKVFARQRPGACWVGKGYHQHHPPKAGSIADQNGNCSNPYGNQYKILNGFYKDSVTVEADGVDPVSYKPNESSVVVNVAMP